MGRRGADPLTAKLLPMIRHEAFRACLESILGPVVIGGSDEPWATLSLSADLNLNALKYAIMHIVTAFSLFF